MEVVDGVEPSEALASELIAFCQERIEPLQVPALRSTSARTLPRTDGGKLYKRLMRDEYWATAERNV